MLPPGSVSRAEGWRPGSGSKPWSPIRAVPLPRRRQGHTDLDAGRRNQAARARHEHPRRRQPHRGREGRLLDLSHDLHPGERPGAVTAACRHRLAAAPVEFIWFGKAAPRSVPAEGPQAQWRPRRRRPAGAFAARRIVERLHPARMGARSRPHDPTGHLRGPRQGHGPVGRCGTTVSELTVLLLPSGRPARAEPNPSQSRLPS